MSEQTRERSLWEHPSRRSFLELSSAVLAGAAVSGLPAGAQEKTEGRRTKTGLPASDPGQENKVLLGENPSSNFPPSTDHGDVGSIWYSFDLTKKRVERGGWTHEVTERVLPSSRDLAGVNMRLAAGSYRELHWHTADEWAYVLYGSARITLMSPDGRMFLEDVSEGDLWLFPAGFPHSIQGLGPDGTEFLLVFNQGGFSEDGTFLISRWLRHTPPEVLAKNLGLDPSELERLPAESLYIFPGTVPGPLEAERAEIGGSKVQPPVDYVFRTRSMTPTAKSDAGEVRIIDSRIFPVSKKIAAAVVRVRPGHMREMHWHPMASEWQFYIAGKARMTVFLPVENARTMDFNANDVGFVPSNAPHYIENTGDEDLVFLELFASPEYMDFSLNQWIRRLPGLIASEHLRLDKATLDRIPAGKRVLI